MELESSDFSSFALPQSADRLKPAKGAARTMTLVAGVSVGGMPALIGDLLVSWRLPSPVELPTRPQTSEMPGVDDFFAAGLAQKILIVRPWLLLAWAGNSANAHRIARGLDNSLPDHPIDITQNKVALDLLSSTGEDDELLMLTIFDNAVHPFAVGTRGFELDGQRIYLMGSGRGAFFEYLQEHPEALPDAERTDGLVARALALRFAARAMTSQWITGAGLGESWGGGFEVAYPDEDQVFRKCDRVLVRGWLIDDQGQYHTSGRSFFSRYYGHDLYLTYLEPERQKTFIVASPVGRPTAPPAFERCSPEWTVDMFLHAPTASFVEFVRMSGANARVPDFFEFADGQLTGWNLDRPYVEDLSKIAIDRAHSGRGFEMFRL